MTWKLFDFLKQLAILFSVLAALYFLGCELKSETSLLMQEHRGEVWINTDSITVSKWLIILDPAHGIETPGKRSPDGRFREYKFSRDVIAMLTEKFDSVGIHYAIDNETENEIGLNRRVSVTNQLVKGYRGKSLFISLHTNAAGNGSSWERARGFSVYTTRGITRADKFAEIIASEFGETFPYIRMIGTREANFRVLLCTPPAVLCEALFQDNEDDVEILLSETYRSLYCDVITRSIQKYILEK